MEEKITHINSEHAQGLVDNTVAIAEAIRANITEISDLPKTLKAFGELQESTARAVYALTEKQDFLVPKSYLNEEE